MVELKIRLGEKALNQLEELEHQLNLKSIGEVITQCVRLQKFLLDEKKKGFKINLQRKEEEKEIFF